jgi:hypothetical protein
MQQMSATARLFAGQLSELTRLTGTTLLLNRIQEDERSVATIAK